MSGRRPEVADVFREHAEEFLDRHGGSLSHEQRQALRDVARCRTAALGGHKSRCQRCAYEEISYNSCRNRHCPKCQASARAQWLDREASYLLPVEYFHVVFTLPAALGPLALSNKHKIYGALLRAVAQTLSTIARDPKHLGAEIGFVAVLHTWGQNLHHHPHVHCVIPGGGLSSDGTRWIPCRRGFFLPVRVLSRLFRGKFLDMLERLHRSGELRLPAALAELEDPAAWEAFVRFLRQNEWVVYSKRPFGGPEQVLKYLARYTHRVAISNQRLLSLTDGNVRFRWKDYAHGSKHRVMEIDALEFMRRFLLHVLPAGFVRIRHYGFLSNRSRQQKLPIVKQLLEGPQGHIEPTTSLEHVEATELSSSSPASARPCPRCENGRLLVVENLAAQLESPEIQLVDTS